MSDQLTLSEQEELANLQRQEAELMNRMNPVPEKSVYSDAAKRIALATGQGIAEASGAALGQKVGLAGAPWTLGLSVPIGGAVGGMAGYEAYMRATNQEPTLGGRLMAGGLGAIPLGPEARLVGEAGKVTAREVAERAAGQGALTLGMAEAAHRIDTKEPMSWTQRSMAAIGGGLGGGISRMFPGTAGQNVEGKPLYVAGSKRAAKAAQEKTRNIKEDAVLDNYRAVGGVSDPGAINPGFISESVEGLGGGQAKMTERLTAINQETNTNLARRQLGLPSDAPLDVGQFSSLRSAAEQPYIKIGELDVSRPSKGTEIIPAPPHSQAYGAAKKSVPSAKKTLNDLEAARAEMKQNWRTWSSDRAKNKASDPDLLEKATESTKRVERLEDALESMAEKAGKPELAQELKDARRRLAQIHVVESAMSSPLGGQLDAVVIGEINRAAPGLLTDNLKLIGDAANVSRQEHIMGTLGRPTSGRAVTYPMRESVLQFATKPGGFYQQGGVPYYPNRAPSALGLFLRNAPSVTGQAMGDQFANQPQ